MKKRNREISIFSMSALDLFASALGAFILLAVIALPYFGNLVPIHAMEPCPIPEPCPEQQICEVCPVCPEPVVCEVCPVCPEPIPEVIKLVDNLLVVEMTWTVSADIDLYIRTPTGDEFSYQRTTIPGVPGHLTLDNRTGPRSTGEVAMEIWKVFNPMVGDYQICFHYFIAQRNSNPNRVRVNSRIDKPTGPVIIPEVWLGRDDFKCVYEFSIDDEFTFNGNVL